ncbi:MAG: hypothetical protein FWH56_00420 [Betaproteobacteria bacterium]|nr:hypothetical protein [Betaproteobacteria bacterium]
MQDSSVLWHENRSDYLPFIRYSLGILQKAYSEFEDRVQFLRYRGLPRSDRIKAVIESKIGKITKKEIMEACPAISKITVERTHSVVETVTRGLAGHS